jgi:hypothetical protein
LRSLIALSSFPALSDSILEIVCRDYNSRQDQTPNIAKLQKKLLRRNNNKCSRKTLKSSSVYTGDSHRRSKKQQVDLDKTLSDLESKDIHVQLNASKLLLTINDRTIVSQLSNYLWETTKSGVRRVLAHNIWRLDPSGEIVLPFLLRKRDIMEPAWYDLWLAGQENQLVLGSLKLIGGSDQQLALSAIKLVGRFAGNGSIAKAQAAIEPLMQAIIDTPKILGQPASSALQSIRKGYSWERQYCPYFRSRANQKPLLERKELYLLLPHCS